jgi:hypothetical protein
MYARNKNMGKKKRNHYCMEGVMTHPHPPTHSDFDNGNLNQTGGTQRERIPTMPMYGCIDKPIKKENKLLPYLQIPHFISSSS